MAYVDDVEIVEMRGGQKAVRFSWHTDPGDDFYEIVDGLKQIPWHERSYDKDSREWTVALPYTDVLEDLFDNAEEDVRDAVARAEA